MKQDNYVTPEMELIEVFAKDIIRTSSNGLGYQEEAGSGDENIGADKIPGLSF